MKITQANPKTEALIGFLLALPFLILFLQLIMGIEPSIGPLDPLIAAEGSRLGTWIVLGMLILSLLGLIVSLAPVVRGLRLGQSLAAYPVNLAVAALILVFFLAIAAGIIVDQYPCWTGAPNCD
jgi:hypothetical protein